MEPMLLLSATTRTTAGILLLALVAVEIGGWFMLRVVRGDEPTTRFQLSFFRAGHAHAGVLVILALVGQIFADAARLEGMLALLARNGIWLAAILMPAGFFVSSMGRGVTEPRGTIALVYMGAVSLALGVVALGLGLLTSQQFRAGRGRDEALAGSQPSGQWHARCVMRR